jgi:putative nucleotidyltransferase with HDIG domain
LSLYVESFINEWFFNITIFETQEEAFDVKKPVSTILPTKELIKIDDCHEGQVVAEDIVTSRGILLLPKNTMINTYIINRLINHAVCQLYIYSTHDKKENEITIKELMETYDKSLNSTKSILHNLAAGKKISYQEIEQTSDFILAKSESPFDVLKCIDELKKVDEYTYTHSFNVAIYSMLIAKWLELSPEQVQHVITAGILHDLGKAQMPSNILNKKGKLLPEEFDCIKKHTIVGYDMSKNVSRLRHDVRQVILMHHEREDGKGYPFGIKGNKIHLYTKIISISDVYDAMTSDRIYKRKTTPFNTFREFQKIGLGHFDTKIMITFLSNIANYYLGSKVRMNTGQIGEIVYLPPHNPSMPVVRIDDSYIDLDVDKKYRIEEMV